jgi:hypothetical protein
MKNRVFTSKNKLVYVVGDLHGDYGSFSKIISKHKKAEEGSLLVFLGDYADRGTGGIEIITELNTFLEGKNNIVALKGNHEVYIDGKPVFAPCDLIYEAQAKYSSWKKFYNEIFLRFLSKLYIAAIINRVLFVHAGISSRIKSISDMEDDSNEEYLIWSDPYHGKGEHPNNRGAGVIFGEDVTTQVLSCLNINLIVRSHEPHKAAYGPFVEHNGKVITINSCNTYDGIWEPFILKVDTEVLHYETIFL